VIVGLGHVDLVCRDVDRSVAFYREVLDLDEPAIFEGERGESIHYLRFPADGSGSLGLRQAFEDQPFELYAPGLHHIAFAVELRSDVDAAYTAAVRARATVLYEPREWPQYRPDYYATFFLDPDGFRIEVATARDARKPI
jgi:catechol 2,3-dioxygenase-like lactoylglutathione lyase family enzyme